MFLLYLKNIIIYNVSRYKIKKYLKNKKKLINNWNKINKYENEY